MDNQTVNTGKDTGNADERTFTQAELNAIVSNRLKEEQAKYGNYEELKEKARKYDAAEEASKTELQKVTDRADALQKQLDEFLKKDNVRRIRDKVSKELQVPAELLTGETEDECKAQATAILSFAKPNTYPVLKDGGEARGSTKRSTRDQFADWFNN